MEVEQELSTFSRGLNLFLVKGEGNYRNSCPKREASTDLEEKPDCFPLKAVGEGELAAGFGEDQFGDLRKPLAGGDKRFEPDGVARSDDISAGEADEVTFSSKLQIGS